MERLLKAIGIWQRDPQAVFSLVGIVIGSAGPLLFLAGIFPLGSVNFWFFSGLLFLFGLYRPNWCFLGLVAVLPFEIIQLSPDSVGLSLRPYQWVFLALSAALVVRLLSGRNRWPLFAHSPLDFFLVLIPIGAFVSGIVGGGQGLRLAVIVTSFYGLYLLGRIFLKTVGDVRVATVTLFTSGLATALYGIVQNIAFEQGVVLRAVMPGRPNALLAEPDWLGFFMALLLVIALVRLAGVLRRSGEDIAGNFSQILLSMLLLLPIVVALILTVSRSAWLASIAALLAWSLVTFLVRGQESIRLIFQSIQSLIIISILALIIVVDVPLTRFDLFNRAESTATGLQEITVACDAPTSLPEMIESVDDLAAFHCRHINLEERGTLQSVGLSIQTVRRPDPNVVIRGEIYARSWKEIQAHPVFGIGWGNIGTVLGTDENGSAYNASNIWFEVMLGAGLLGLAGLLGALGFVVYRGLMLMLRKTNSSEATGALPLIAALVTILLAFNLFNTGLLIGFVWVGLAALPPLLPLAEEATTV